MPLVPEIHFCCYGSCHFFFLCGVNALPFPLLRLPFFFVVRPIAGKTWASSKKVQSAVLICQELNGLHKIGGRSTTFATNQLCEEGSRHGRHVIGCGGYCGLWSSTPSRWPAFLPKDGLDKLLVHPGSPGPLQLLAATKATGTVPSAIFFAGSTPLPADLTSKVVATEEGWVYGGVAIAKADNPKLYLSLVTGSPGDVSRGSYYSFSHANMEKSLHIIDKYMGYSPEKSGPGETRRGVVSLVRSDGEAVDAYWYYITLTSVKTKAKQVLNDPRDLVVESIDGYLLSQANMSRLPYRYGQVIVRNDWDPATTNKVAIISGGGSGHEPAHAGYLGEGMLTAVVPGKVFASPNAESVFAAIMAVMRPGGPGVLLIVKRYTGDRLNFGIAAEQARGLGVDVSMVVVADDCALPKQKGITGGRGIAGTVLVHKLAGAAAREGLSLAEVTKVAQHTADNVRSMGVSLSSCTLPGEPKDDRLSNDVIELGLGIHGEPGFLKSPPLKANVLVDRIIGHITNPHLKDHDTLPLEKGDKVALLVNNLGSTTPLELAVVSKRAHEVLHDKGVKVSALIEGPFMTSLDMHGFSLSILKLSKEDEKRCHAPTRAPAWPKSIKFRSLPIEKPFSLPHAPGKLTTLNLPAGGPSAYFFTPLGKKIAHMISAAAKALLDAEPTLTRMDKLVGDGDCGQTFASGASYLMDRIQRNHVLNQPDRTGLSKHVILDDGHEKKPPGDRPEQPLHVNDPVLLTAELAHVANHAMGGTSGALYNILFTAMHASLKRSAKTVEHLDLVDYAKACEAGVAAIETYGGAQQGYRTMLDSLAPAAKAFSAAVAKGLNTQKCMEAAVTAAEEGAQATQEMEAMAGRSNYVPRETLRSTPDPGAQAAASPDQTLRNLKITGASESASPFAKTSMFNFLITSTVNFTIGSVGGPVPAPASESYYANLSELLDVQHGRVISIYKIGRQSGLRDWDQLRRLYGRWKLYEQQTSLNVTPYVRLGSNDARRALSRPYCTHQTNAHVVRVDNTATILDRHGVIPLELIGTHPMKWAPQMRTATLCQAINIWGQAMQLPPGRVRDYVARVLRSNLRRFPRIFRNSLYTLKTEVGAAFAKPFLRSIPIYLLSLYVPDLATRRALQPLPHPGSCLQFLDNIDLVLDAASSGRRHKRVRGEGKSLPTTRFYLDLLRARFLHVGAKANEVDGFLCWFSQRTRPEEPGRATEPAPINQDDIARTKILLDGLVVCALDKNPNSLWVECPVLTYGRMEKEVVRAPCFMPCNRKPEDILDEYFQLYISRNLKRFGKLARKLTRLHSALIFPKDKSPIEKSRLVCNQKRSPWRYVLRNLGRILIFVVLECSKHCVNFNLSDLSKVQELLHRAMARFRAQDGTAHLFAYQFDVKQMFTWLSKQSVLQSVMFALRFIQTYGRSDGRSCRRVEAFQVSRKPWSVAGGAPKHQVGYKTSTAKDNFYFFTFQDVIALVQLDLDHAHFAMGNGVFMQLHVCPIGGYISAQLAVLKCMVDEHTNLTAYIPRPLRKSFFGIRQVDDLLLLVTLPPCHPVVHRLLTAIRNSGQSQQSKHFYTGGLELEEETTVTKGLYHFLVLRDMILPCPRQSTEISSHGQRSIIGLT
eukprot:g20578.t1